MGRWVRGIVLGVAAAGMLAIFTAAARAELVGESEADRLSGPRYVLRLHHLHTDEDINVVYRVGDTYLPGALDKLNLFLRDHRTQDASVYDPKEFDLLHSLMTKLHRPSGVIDIVCGYRTPESNDFLRTLAPVTGVAEHSQHMLAKAIDIRVPGVRTLALRNAALSLGAGGVGYYPKSQFVHVDVGPVREWQYGEMRRARTLSVRARGVRVHHRLRRTA